MNVGAAATITVSADTGGTSLLVSLALCQTNPATGQCVSATATSVSTTIAQGEAPTFSIFGTGIGVVSFDLAQYGIFVRFKDASGDTRGSTSVRCGRSDVTRASNAHLQRWEATSR